MTLRSIALFCGSSPGFDPKYARLAQEFGKKCADLQLNLIYGGACVGLMGEAANSALGNQGKVTGIFPSFFSSTEIAHDNLTEMIIVKSMSERKRLLENKADAFVILPGSYGTMDELFEVLTNGQLGFHKKPLGILNAFGYYNGLLMQLEHFLQEGFLKKCHYNLLVVADSVNDMLSKLLEYENSNDSGWLAKIRN